MKSKISRNFSILMCSFLLTTTVAFCQTDPNEGPPPSLSSDHELFNREPSSPPDVGQSFIVGELRKIEDRKLTVRRPDGVDHTIEVHGNTKFVDAHGDAITLAKFKIGDRVAGIGALKNNVFVLAELREAPIDLSTLPPPSVLAF